MSQTPAPVGNDVQVNTVTSNFQTHPAVAALEGGGFVVSWESQGQDGYTYGIYAQRFAADGTPVSGPFQVNTFFTYEQRYASVAALEGGGFVVSWTSYRQDSGIYHGVYAQRYAADGTPVGGEFRVNTHSNEQILPSVAGLDGGGFVVTWASKFQDESNGWGVYGQRYNADGTAAGGEFLVNSFVYYSQEYPSVAALSDGGFMVTWQSSNQDGNYDGVYAQRYAADGTPVGGEFLVNTTTFAFQVYPSVTALPDGGFVVAWNSPDGGGIGLGIYGQRYAADGSPVGGEFRVNSHITGAQDYPSVTALPDGGFVVTWSSNGQDGSGYGVYGQRYAADGTSVGDEFRINQITAGQQYARSFYGSQLVATLANGRLVQVWSGDPTEEVFFRLVDVPPPPATVTPDRVIDSTEVADASYVLSGLATGATAVVTFSDGVTQVSSGVLNADGTYTIDLSSLSDGPLTTSVTVTDSFGVATNTSPGGPTLLANGIFLRLTLGQWNAFGAAEAAENDAFSDIIVLLNGKAAVQALTPAMIATLADQGVGAIDATGSELVLSADQYLALIAENVSMTSSDYVVLRDAAANLLSTLETEIGESGVDRFDAIDNLLSFTVAEYDALSGVGLTASDKVTLADTGANIAALTAGEIGGLAAELVDYIDATDNAPTLTLVQYQALGAVKLTAADMVTLVADGADIEAMTPAELGALAGKGIDLIDTTDDALALGAAQLNALKTVQVADGDALTVTGSPTAANTFDFGSQIFGDTDKVVGGSAADKLILGGIQSVAFGADSLGSINKLMLKDGGDYTLATDDANVGAGKVLVVTAMGGSLIFDGSAESDGSFKFEGGGGTSTFTGGARGDTLLLGGGAETLRYTAASQSTGFGHDKVTGFDVATDSFDIWTSATLDAAITTGMLKGGAQFEAALTTAMEDLEAGHAVLFTADAGNLAGVSFLAINTDGALGWQSGSDLVLRMTDLTGTLTAANFV